MSPRRVVPPPHEHVLVGVRRPDDHGRDALALAVRLARALHAELILAGTWSVAFGPHGGAYDTVMRRGFEATFDALAGAIPHDVVWDTALGRGTSSVRALHDLATHTRASAIVLGPTHLGRLGHLVVGDAALAALHGAPCAVAVASPGTREREAAGRIVVGWDGSVEAREALESAVRLAAGQRAGVELVAVAGSPPGADARAALDDGLAAVDGRVPASATLRVGVVAAELAGAARGASLLAVGSRAHGAAHRVVVGSTSAGLLHRARVPVLVLPRGTPAVRLTPEAPPRVGGGRR
jgi:nucleotide-binding universal stress UspA family protein